MINKKNWPANKKIFEDAVANVKEKIWKNAILPKGIKATKIPLLYKYHKEKRVFLGEDVLVT